MSATVDADRFSQYWGCPVLYVPGRQFSVNVRHIRSVGVRALIKYFKSVLAMAMGDIFSLVVINPPVNIP